MHLGRLRKEQQGAAEQGYSQVGIDYRRYYYSSMGNRTPLLS